MKKYSIFQAAALSFFILASAQLHASVISDFGSSDFTIDGGSTSFAFTQTINNTQISGTDFGNTFAGTFVTFDLSGFTDITLTGFSSINPGSAFTIEFFDPTFTETKTFTSSFGLFGASSTTVTLSFVSETAPFSNIAGLLLTTSGSGDPVTFTLENVSAVPEPSSALLLGLGAAGLYLLRRRKAKA